MLCNHIHLLLIVISNRNFLVDVRFFGRLRFSPYVFDWGEGGTKQYPQ